MTTVLMLVLWLMLIPLLTGILFSNILPASRQTVAIIYILGILVQYSLFFIIALPCMLNMLYTPFWMASRIFSVTMYAVAALGLCMLLHKMRPAGSEKSAGFAIAFVSIFPGEHHAEPEALMNPHIDLTSYRQRYGRESYFYWLLFAILLGFQLYMAVTSSFFDGDDSYYVVQSLTAQELGRMYRVVPYTGETTRLDSRHALAMLPIWEAFIAQKAGLHATIFAHTTAPFFFLPLGYLVYGQIARILFRGRQQLVPVFMCIICFLQVFGNISIYTAETFFITRTAQGKACMAAIVVPMILWIFMWLFEDQKKTVEMPTHTDKMRSVSPWIMLALINIFAGLCTSIGVLLASGMTVLLTLSLVWYAKKVKLLLPAMLSCVPNLLYVMLYVWLR